MYRKKNMSPRKKSKIYTIITTRWYSNDFWPSMGKNCKSISQNIAKRLGGHPK